MEYVSTRNCMQDIVRTMGTVSVEQLVRFFRGAGDAEQVEFYIREFLSFRIFDYDKIRNWVSYHGTPAVNEEVTRRRVMAFWVLAYFGYENIREVSLLKYPSQLLFITEDNQTYDLTVCTSEREASAAGRARKLLEFPEVKDDVNHIAIVRDKKVGALALPYGFDSYCILGEDKVPAYFTE